MVQIITQAVLIGRRHSSLTGASDERGGEDERRCETSNCEMHVRAFTMPLGAFGRRQSDSIVRSFCLVGRLLDLRPCGTGHRARVIEMNGPALPFV